MFAMCNNGAWYVIPCAAGTACYVSGNSANCDWPNGRSTTGCARTGFTATSFIQDLFKENRITKPSLRPKPAIAAGTAPARIEFVAADISYNQYTTVIKIQTNKDAFTNFWAFTFDLPDNQTITSSSRGSVTVNGSTVTIVSNPNSEKPRNMAATFKFTGTFTGDYVLPDTSSATFNSA
ncbi:hypothetical protein GGI12_003389 [Dipsacomyces acuminosporus]|nr:hypothetical protein GGI12_003389 [Dipsacomyces acuminosporus]